MDPTLIEWINDLQGWKKYLWHFVFAPRCEW